MLEEARVAEIRQYIPKNIKKNLIHPPDFRIPHLVTKPTEKIQR